jgi:thiamine pyrophosphokinase
VLKFFHQIKISLIAEDSFLKAYKGNVKINTCSGETISLYGLDKKTKITSSGLKYHLSKTALPSGERESTSNVATGNKVELKIKGGIIFVIRDINLMMKYDLF